MKPTEDYRRNARNADGLSTYCTPCFKVRDKVAYRRRRAAGGYEVKDRLRLDGEKRCADCSEIKPLSDFDLHPRQSGGRNCYCKPCRSKRNRDWRFLREYGLTPQAYQELVDGQDGLCAVCRERPSEHVDHDHLTGAVRGVLCFPCNAALGQLKDRVDLMRNAIDYLERTTWQRQQVRPGVFRLTSPRPAAAPSRSSSALQHRISSRRG
jgi:hypothetical protein